MRAQQLNAKVNRLNWITGILIAAIFVTAAAIVYLFFPTSEDENALKVRTMMLYDAVVGQPYTLTLEAVHGESPYTFEVAGLPEGLSYDSSTQSISGIAQNVGIFEVDVSVTDLKSKSASLKYKFNVVEKASEVMAFPLLRISAGDQYSAALMDNGDLLTWGSNRNGQLGRDTDGKTSLEVTKALVNTKSVHASIATTLAVRKDGTLWAFGINSNGQYGNGTLTNSIIPVFIMDNVAAVSGGSTYSMAIKNDNTLWAFGANKQYQLGTGDLKNTSAPVKIMDDVVLTSCGEYTAFALKKDGTLWAWGQNTHGESGIDNGEDFIKVPTQIPGMTGVVSVSSGHGHTLAIKDDGSLWAWGYNQHGQVGNGGSDDVKSPVKVMDNVRYVSGGKSHSLVVTESGELWGAGSNEYGQLCDAPDNSPDFVKLMDNVDIASAGGYHSLVLMQDSSLMAFGSNDSGQLGVANNEGEESIQEPVVVIESLAD